MPKRTTHRSTDVSLDYLNNVNTESKRRRTINEHNIYDLPTSPPKPRETPRSRRPPLSEAATRFRNLRNRQIGVDSRQHSVTPRSPANERQQSPNHAPPESDDNQSAEPEHIDESLGPPGSQNETESIGRHQAVDSDQRQSTPSQPIHSSFEDLFVPIGAQDESQEPRNGGFVSINGPRRVSSRTFRPRARASDLFPAKVPETTGAQDDGDENSSPASVDGHSDGVQSSSEDGDSHNERPSNNSAESDTTEDIGKDGPDSNRSSVGEGEEEEEEEEEDRSSTPHINLFSDESEPDAGDGPDEHSSTEVHSPIPAQHSLSHIEVQIPIHTKDSRSDSRLKNRLGRRESSSSQNEHQDQVPKTPAQPPRRRRDNASREKDAVYPPTTSTRRHESPHRRGTLALDEDNDVRLGLFSWLKDTVKDSGFKEDWQVICHPRRLLKSRADTSLNDYFRGIGKLIQRLRDLYKDMAREPSSANSSMTDHCRLIANSIFNEGQSTIVEQAPEYEDAETGGHLVNQFEAHIVPDLIKLLIVAFKTYRTAGDCVKPHFRIALDLLWAICHRISCIKDVDHHIGPYVLATSHEVLSHIKVIKDALNDGRLQGNFNLTSRVSKKYKHFELSEVRSNITCDPWTGAEKRALLDGMNVFDDEEDVFLEIKCDMTYGLALERRTLQDLQEKARQLKL